MDPARASATAMGTALMRSAHSRLGDPPLIDDPWGDRLLGDGVSDSGRDAALLAHPSCGTVVMRSRYAEDALRAAVARGTSQYVIVGAGLDSFALRRPEWADGVRVFEVDHPATQGFKLERLAERGHEIPPGVEFLAADLGVASLDGVLARSSFDARAPVFMAWLGVTPYLTEDANRATWRAIARSSPAVELAFSYLDRAAVEGALDEVRGQVASLGEPWVSGYDPGTLAGELRACGLALVEDLGPDELARRYCTGRLDGLRPSPGAHVALARSG